ncbi:MAG TPA: hypothetical protein VFP46_00225 [Candidatus Paceibacterota bacterium]|nr:hypothetical protein [Candidatus Paceibacterota bacterium]
MFERLFGLNSKGLGDRTHEELIKSQKPVEDYHLDDVKANAEPAADLVKRAGIEGAKAELQDILDSDPGNEEARRQLNLIERGKFGQTH